MPTPTRLLWSWITTPSPETWTPLLPHIPDLLDSHAREIQQALAKSELQDLLTSPGAPRVLAHMEHDLDAWMRHTPARAALATLLTHARWGLPKTGTRAWRGTPRTANAVLRVLLEEHQDNTALQFLQDHPRLLVPGPLLSLLEGHTPKCAHFLLGDSHTGAGAVRGWDHLLEQVMNRRLWSTANLPILALAWRRGRAPQGPLYTARNHLAAAGVEHITRHRRMAFLALAGDVYSTPLPEHALDVLLGHSPSFPDAL